ncbi:hypothetical protein FOA43_002487 [Brettanomyces nanus]|uniref:Major facilitator superfamily (MFS) profile domain-containing protein n=1 Tax=Eeniella nana TaxID=13502 RepID=A0A875S2K1_EENNA|nr:uncharacterized protein FOA43_002487 [Brettanomyces nanus]QPG75143.1 hypothetical protein FOA43_002487 [Brettanomyces nanus]
MSTPNSSSVSTPTTSPISPAQPLSKNVTFGVVTQKGSSSAYRRSSVGTQPPSFRAGAFSCINEGSSSLAAAAGSAGAAASHSTSGSASGSTSGSFNQPVIPPPIPESLPTTPGYELNGTSYFDMPGKDSFALPQQQTVLASVNDDGNSSNTHLENVSQGLTLENSFRNKWRLVASIIFAMSGGLSDGAPGALLPRMESYYGINYTVVSLIWISNAIGFIVIAVFSHKLEPILGSRNLQSLGCACLIIMYSMVCSAPAFPVVVVAFFFGGIGLATNYSFQNLFLSRFEKSSIYLGFYHGSYGFGACVGPLVATVMVNQGVKWSYFYCIMLCLSAFNMVNQFLAFKGYEKEFRAWESDDPLVERNASTPEAAEVTVGIKMVKLNTKNNAGASSGEARETTFEDVNPDTRLEGRSVGIEELHAALKTPITWYLAFFVLFYQGAEVSMGGWIVTFLEVYRHGSTRNTGYVASGFWGGLTIGRLFFTPSIHRFVGAKRGISILIVVSLICCTLAWVLPVLIVEAVFVALFGLFTGPIYPLMITVAVRILPRKIQVISMTIITALGSSGGAIFPFLVGLISQFAGTYVVMPFILGLLSSALVLWYLLPNPDRLVIRYIWQRIW